MRVTEQSTELRNSGVLKESRVFEISSELHAHHLGGVCSCLGLKFLLLHRHKKPQPFILTNIFCKPLLHYSSSRGTTIQPRNRTHGDVYFGMLWLLMTNPAKPLALGIQLGSGFAFCKLAGGRIAVPFPTAAVFVLRTHHHPRGCCWVSRERQEFPALGQSHILPGPRSAFPKSPSTPGLRDTSLCSSFMSWLLYLRIISPLHLLDVMQGCYQLK